MAFEGERAVFETKNDDSWLKWRLIAANSQDKP